MEQEARCTGIGPLEVEWLCEEGEAWQAVLLREISFPLSREAHGFLTRFFAEFDAVMEGRSQSKPETFLEYSRLYVGDCATKLQERASVIQPKMGLGVYPDQAPPELWTAEELGALPAENQKIRPLMNTVLRTASAPDVQRETVETFLVTGGVVRFYLEDVRGFLRASKETLLPTLVGSIYQGFLFYLPLLNAGTFRGSATAELDGWLPQCGAYLAESHTDRGMVVAYRGDLAGVLVEVGRRMDG